MGEEVFYECDNLTELTIDPKWFKRASAYNATRVSIPSGVTAIPEGAFSGYEKLASVSIPNTVKSIGKNAFNSCYALSGITIPNSVTSIGEKAFSYCDGLTSVVIQ